MRLDKILKYTPSSMIEHADSFGLVFHPGDTLPLESSAIKRTFDVLTRIENNFKDVPVMKVELGSAVCMSYESDFLRHAPDVPILPSVRKKFEILPSGIRYSPPTLSMGQVLDSLLNDRIHLVRDIPFIPDGFIVPIYNTHFETMLLQSNLMFAEWIHSPSPDNHYRKLSLHLDSALETVNASRIDQYVLRARSRITSVIDQSKKKGRNGELLGMLMSTALEEEFQDLYDETFFNNWSSIFSYQRNFARLAVDLRDISPEISDGLRKNSLLYSQACTAHILGKPLLAVDVASALSDIKTTVLYSAVESSAYHGALQLMPTISRKNSAPAQENIKIPKPKIDYFSMLRSAVCCSSNGFEFYRHPDVPNVVLTEMRSEMNSHVDRFINNVITLGIDDGRLRELGTKLLDFDLPNRLQRKDYASVVPALTKVLSTVYSDIKCGRIPSSKELKQNL